MNFVDKLYPADDFKLKADAAQGVADERTATQR
jgi:hypothetical protein